MSHVDDGTLHAFLDGELSAVEAERLETHLAGCPACQARLDEERALIERAELLLGAAAPPGRDRVPPPLSQLRRPRPMSRLRVPLAWAATILVALGLGWYAGTLGLARAPERASAIAHLDTAPAPAPTAVAQAPAAPPAEGRRSQPAAPAAGAGAVADASTRAESDERRQVAKAAEPAALRSLADAARDQAAASPVPARPTVTAQAPRDRLSIEPAAIPGFPILAVRPNPEDAGGIVVEQRIDSGVVISLFERRTGADAEALRGSVRTDSIANLAALPRARANERLARFVGGWRIEIAGPLPVDSLSKLLELVRP